MRVEAISSAIVLLGLEIQWISRQKWQPPRASLHNPNRWCHPGRARMAVENIAHDDSEYLWQMEVEIAVLKDMNEVELTDNTNLNLNIHCHCAQRWLIWVVICLRVVWS
jgi:hypothetical protein